MRNEIQLSQIQSLSQSHIYFILHFVLQLHALPLMAEGNNKGPMVSNRQYLTPARESGWIRRLANGKRNSSQ
jgi:hypothetical protein